MRPRCSSGCWPACCSGTASPRRSRPGPGGCSSTRASTRRTPWPVAATPLWCGCSVRGLPALRRIHRPPSRAAGPHAGRRLRRTGARHRRTRRRPRRLRAPGARLRRHRAGHPADLHARGRTGGVRRVRVRLSQSTARAAALSPAPHTTRHVRRRPERSRRRTGSACCPGPSRPRAPPGRRPDAAVAADPTDARRVRRGC